MYACTQYVYACVPWFGSRFVADVYTVTVHRVLLFLLANVYIGHTARLPAAVSPAVAVGARRDADAREGAATGLSGGHRPGPRDGAGTGRRALSPYPDPPPVSLSVSGVCALSPRVCHCCVVCVSG